MTKNKFLIASILIIICGAAWFGLPMSVLSEKHPTLTTILKVAGSLCGLIGGWFLYLGFKKQGPKETDTNLNFDYKLPEKKK